MHSGYLLPRVCVLSREVASLECPLREGLLYTLIFISNYIIFHHQFFDRNWNHNRSKLCC